jgi:hypothetical protein
MCQICLHSTTVKNQSEVQTGEKLHFMQIKPPLSAFVVVVERLTFPELFGNV